jgi:hypothetical protein
MPDEDRSHPYERPVTVMISADGIAARLAQLPTRKEMYRAILLGVTTIEMEHAADPGAFGCDRAQPRTVRVDRGAEGLAAAAVVG